MMEVIYVAIIIAFCAVYCYTIKKRRTMESAKSKGLIIDGKHYKVYRVLRCESVTMGGLYQTHHNIHDFGEVLLVSPKGEEIMTTESRLLFCLKKRKHEANKIVNGKRISRWSEWEIDPNGSDERGLRSNVIYLGTF